MFFFLLLLSCSFSFIKAKVSEVIIPLHIICLLNSWLRTYEILFTKKKIGRPMEEPSPKRIRVLCPLDASHPEGSDVTVWVSSFDQLRPAIEKEAADSAPPIQLPEEYELTKNFPLDASQWPTFFEGSRNLTLSLQRRQKEALHEPRPSAPRPVTRIQMRLGEEEQARKARRLQRKQVAGLRERDFNYTLSVSHVAMIGSQPEKPPGSLSIRGVLELGWELSEDKALDPSHLRPQNELIAQLVEVPSYATDECNIAPAAIVVALCCDDGYRPAFELEISLSNDVSLVELHDKMKRVGSTLWVPEYDTKLGRELHLVAVTYQDGSHFGVDVRVFLAYTRQLEKRDAKSPLWASSPVLRECERLWRGRTPLVLDLDGTLGCRPANWFPINENLRDDASFMQSYNNGSCVTSENALQAFQELARKYPDDRKYAMEVDDWKWKVRRWKAFEQLQRTGDYSGTGDGLLLAGGVRRKYVKSDDTRVLFLRPDLELLLSVATTKFDSYIVTAASSDDARLYGDGFARHGGSRINNLAFGRRMGPSTRTQPDGAEFTQASLKNGLTRLQVPLPSVQLSLTTALVPEVS